MFAHPVHSTTGNLEMVSFPLYTYFVHDDHLLTVVTYLRTQSLPSCRDRGTVLPDVGSCKGSLAITAADVL